MEIELRLILLGIGVVVIALIYFWGMRQRIKAGLDERRRRKLAVRAPENQPVFQTAESAIGGIEESPFIEEQQSIAAEFEAADAIETPAPMPTATPIAETAAAKTPMPEPSAAQVATTAAPTQVTPERSAKSAEKTVLLSVLGQGGKPLRGPAIAAAAHEMALTLNNSGVLECSTDASKDGKTIFSIAHLKEPGTFDPNTINSLSTPGLLLFMQLPGPLEAVAAVDLMMATAGQLAKHLGGSVCDERRHKMTTQAMIHLRSEAADFERRLATQQTS